MSRFSSVLKKLDPDKQDAINTWIKNATAPKTAHDPITTNIANNLKTEEHFDQTALENFLNPTFNLEVQQKGKLLRVEF